MPIMSIVLLRHLVCIILAAAVTAGCGFKLRGAGTVRVSEAISTVAINGGNQALTERLAAELADNGITVANDPDGVAVIRFARADYTRQTRDTNADGIASRYDYRYEVDFEVRDAQADILLPSAEISQTRTLDYDASRELEFEENEAFLREEMEQQIVLQILRYLERI